MRLKKEIGLSAVLVTTLLSGVPAYAELQLNFSPQGNGYWALEAGTWYIEENTTIGGDPGILMPEQVVDPETGITYWHVVIRDQTNSFLQETFIQKGIGPGCYNSGIAPTSASGGTPCDNGPDTNRNDPLDIIETIDSGIGSASVTRTLVRQLVSDGEITMEFLKDKLDRKPLITQIINMPGQMSSMFQLDMRNSTYEDDTTPGTLYNILTLSGFGAGNFNYTTDRQVSTITGGRYTFTGEINGTYQYVDSDFDHTLIDWASYFDPFQDNPWSVDENKPQ